MMFRYKVEFYTEHPELYNNVDKFVDKVIERGLVAASSYGEAANSIVTYYVGKNTDDMCDLEIYEVESLMSDPEIADIMTLGC